MRTQLIILIFVFLSLFIIGIIKSGAGESTLGIYVTGGSLNLTTNTYNYTYNYNATNETAFTDLNMNGYSIWNGSSANFSSFNGSIYCIGTSCITSWSSSGDNATWNESRANALYYPLSGNPAGYLTSFIELDPKYNSNPLGYINNTSWNTTAWNGTLAFNSTLSPYDSKLSSYTETDPLLNGNFSTIMMNNSKNNGNANFTDINTSKTYVETVCINPSCLKNMTSNSTHIIIQNGG